MIITREGSWSQAGGKALQDKVVLNHRGIILKGYADRAQWVETGYARRIDMKLLETGKVESVSLDGSKAVFFVRSFEGSGHDPLRFHDHLVPANSLWVRATFRDREVVEGIIANTGSFVMEDGFAIYPTDPKDNNLLIFVFKEQLKDFQVLGLRVAELTRES